MAHQCNGCAMCKRKYACYVTQCDASDIFPNSFMIVNGINTTVSSNSLNNTIQINANVPGADVTLTGVGGGQNLVVDGVGPDLVIRTLVSGNGISLSTVGNTIIVSANESTAPTVTLANTGAGSYGLVVDGLGPDLTIKTINAGTNITIDDSSNVLTINADNAPTTTLANTGAGSYGLVVDGLGPDLTIKTINAGTNITIDDSSNVLTINAATTTLANTGAGSYGLVVDGLGPDLTIKTINAGTNITIDDSSNVLTINANDAPVTTLANTGAGSYGLVVDSLGPDLTIKTINAGTNITIDDSSNVLTINANNAPVTTLANTGAGSYGLVVDGLGPDLTIKTINAGTNITIDDSSNVLTINANNAPTVTLANTGSGSYGLVVDGLGPDLTIKTINAGTNITIDDSSNVLTINAATTTLANTGSGSYGLVVDGLGPDLTIKTINAGTNITIDDSSNVLTINAATTTLANTGAGSYGLVVDGLGPDLTIKTINAGTNITIDDSSNVLTINAATTTLANTGAGSYGLVVDGLGPDLTIKTINAGTNITIDDSSNVLTINADNAPTTTLANTGAGSYGLVVDGLGPDLTIKTINAGTNITIDDVSNVLTINANNAPVTTLANTGAGSYGLVVDGLGPDLTIKTINAGTNITIDDSSNVLTINANNAPVTTLANTGAGLYGLVVDGLGPDLTIKTINAGTNITIDDSSNVLTINAATTTLANTGAGSYGLVVDGLGLDLTIKTINAGTNITIDDVANVLTINAATTTLANTGAGSYGLVVDGLGPDITIKTINAGTNITIDDSSNVLTINAATTTLANTGAGSYGLVVDGLGPDLTIKTINAGTNITIDDSSNVLTINANNVPVTTLANTGAGSYGLVVDGLGPDLTIKTINAGNGITIGDLANVLTINANAVTLANTGAGSYGLVVTGTGFNHTIKTINAGNNITIGDSANVLTINANLSGIVSNVSYYFVSNTVLVSLSSANTLFVPIPQMTVTPVSGTYYVQFSADHLQTGSAISEYLIRANSVNINDSRRVCSITGVKNIPISTQTIVTVNGSEVVDTAWLQTNSGSISANARNMILLKLF
jgi:hypothetical protein